ncbi:phenylalanine--tRNA ligase subunit beta [Patulibacter defluvii]|uniref:phenylalanine--tRNA ligase subunit beta n=1 Tax=Patulibacter defluvii TaxID=3095358 RepID=UPI002A75AA1C|nr:phenylalanine--tRNA ligase subunit beta [Patulibacter sp. DM4]
MRVPLSWLGELVDVAERDATEVAARLNVTGTELDRLLHHGVRTPETIVVGRVLAADQHPDADRLKVCRVEIGEAEPSQIVCGAPNVAAGLVVAVARIGTVMPEGMKIKRAKLRGVVSEGMICSARELGIGDAHEGILALNEQLPGAEEIAPGTPLSEVLPHADEVLELEITPNRPDCLGLYGIAREVAAATGAALRPAPWTRAGGLDEEAGEPDPAGDAIDGFAIEVRTPRCPRFTARLFEGVTIGPSPLWLQARLSAAGQRPINNVVDITNYVMLVTGQPLHAFDADRIAGGRLVVREAADGETLTTLDDQQRSVRAGELVIADDEGITSLAAVMGGARSEVHEGTTRVLLEVANWDGPTIHRTAQRLGLFSEAASRNAKGLAPEQAAWAQVLATRLLEQVAGARRVGGTIDVGDWRERPAPEPIVLREARVARLLGTAVARPRQAELLASLGFEVADADPAAPTGEGSLLVTVPPERRDDVSREIDLIEEIARIGVVADLQPTLPVRRRLTAATLSPAQRARRRAEDVLVGRGLQEVAGWSFTDPGAAERLGLAADDPRAAAVRLANPLSEDHAVLRPTILVSLLDIARRNRARGVDDVRIFETGTVFRDHPDPRRPDMPFEHQAIAALVQDDVFAAKGLLEALFDALGIGDWSVDATDEVAFLHPGRAARVLVGGGPEPQVVGLLGEVHPRVAERWDLPRTAVFLIDLDQLLPLVPEEVAFRDVGQFPDARFDLAVVVADDVTAAAAVTAAREAGGPLLERVDVFDAYRGQGIPDGHVSLALHVRLRAADRTLAEEEISEVRDRIVTALAERVGGVLRG